MDATNNPTPRTPRKIAIINLLLWPNLPFRLFLDLHGGSFNSCIPPQSPLFPTIENPVSLPKTPPMGTSPSKLLYDKLRICSGKSARNFGISPEKLFCDRSNLRRPLSAAKLGGMTPLKRLPAMYRVSNARQSARVLGISPDNLVYLTER
uniref:Uncharacterized protein n=1 Tax=Opuntia streptacantha TaxID=393608 RepID=A0A7C9AV95_OPUST